MRTKDTRDQSEIQGVAPTLGRGNELSLDTANTISLFVEECAGSRYIRVVPKDNTNRDLAPLTSMLSSKLRLVIGKDTHSLNSAIPRPDSTLSASIKLGDVSIASVTISGNSVDTTVDRLLTSFDTRQLSRLASATDDAMNRYLENFAKIKTISSLPTRQVDLHTHFAGELAADKLVALGIQNNALISKEQLARWNLLVPGESARWHKDSRGIEKIGLNDYFEVIKSSWGESKAKEMQSTLTAHLEIPAYKTIPFKELSRLYDDREFLCQDPNLFRPILREIALQYKDLGVAYAELSLSPITNPKFLKAAHEELPILEKEFGVRIRFLAGLRRTDSAENLVQLVDIVKYVARGSPYVVGVDFMGHETNSTKEFAKFIKEIRAFKDKERPDFQIRVHAGENARYAENVIVAIESGATRIGHGLRGVDSRVFQMAREKGVIMELNLNSNSALNNLTGINLPEEVIIGRYLQNGIRVTLGSDGSGAYQAGGRQESYAALMCGISNEQLEQINESDAQYIAQQKTQEEQLKKNLEETNDTWFSKIPVFSPVSQRLNHAAQLDSLKQILSTQGVILLETPQIDGLNGPTQSTLRNFCKGRPVIAFSGASKTFNNLSDDEKIKVDNFLSNLFVDLRDKGLLEHCVFVTGGTNEGVEALVHLHARKYGADVLGVISESTTGAIQPNTITHATFAGRGWYDVLPAQISLVEQSGGSMIFIGGGDIVKDAIQAAKNSNIEFALLNGVTGAADEKAVLYPDKAIRHASEALEKLVQIIDNYHARTAWNPPGSLPTSVTQVSVGNLIRGQDAQTTIGILRNSSLQYSHLLSLKNDPSGRPTVGQHSEAVMNQLLRYPFKELLKQDEIELLKVLIACHDLEKYPEHGNREDSPEHDRAEKWLRKFAPLFGLDDTRIEIAATLIQSKIIGKLMKDIAPARLNSDAKRSMSRLIMEQPEDTRNKKYQECIDELYLKAAESKVGKTEYHKMIDVACQAICNEANHCGLSSSDYLLLAMAFYQSDCSTYTADSRCESGNLRGDLSMEFLFELNSDSNFNTNEPMIDFDHSRGRMKMRGIFESAIRDLETAIGKVSAR